MDIKPMISPERLEQDAELLQEWLAKQPHLPKIDDKKRLICFLHHNKYSLEKTKQKLDNYYTLRNKYPEIFKNRDPYGQAVARARASYNVCLAKTLSKDGGRIIYTQPNPDTSIYNVTDFITYGTIICDLFYLEHELHEYSANITDCAGLQYGHLVRSLPWLKAAMDIFLNCYVTRFKAFHMINVSPGLEMVFTRFKNFLPAKFVDRFYVHTSAESLLKVVDKELVCSEYGGTGPSLTELDQHTIKLVEKYKDWFLEQGNISSNEQLRRKGENQVEEMKGSFRKLEVD